MFGLDQALGRKPKEEAPIVMAASDQPVDIDHEGIRVPVDEGVSVDRPAAAEIGSASHPPTKKATIASG